MMNFALMHSTFDIRNSLFDILVSQKINIEYRTPNIELRIIRLR